MVATVLASEAWTRRWRASAPTGVLPRPPSAAGCLHGRACSTVGPSAARRSWQDAVQHECGHLVWRGKKRYTALVNQPLKATARNGRLVMDVPTDLPDGKEVEVVIVSDDVDFAEPWMDADEAKAFNEEFRAAAEDEAAGLLVPAEEVIANLFASA